jgi:hypothetical protein
VSDQSVIYPIEVPYGVLGVDPDLVVNVMAWGAIGDGTTSDAVALQDAVNQLADDGGVLYFPPGRRYYVDDDITIPANVTVWGYGATVVVAPAADWVSPTYFGIHRVFKNANPEELTIVDENITYLGLTVDATLQNTCHCFFTRKARNVTFRDVHTIGGGDGIALLSNDNTLITDCVLEGFSNCGADHWDASKDAKLINTTIRCSLSSQMVNFNGRGIADDNGVSDGFLMDGCTLESTEATATPCQIEPLSNLTGSTTKNVTIVNNTFINSWLVCRGKCENYLIANNTFRGLLGGTQVIVINPHPVSLVVPDNFMVTNNRIIDPGTTSGLGVIYIDASTVSVTLNRITGSSYGVNPGITIINYPAVMFGNEISNGVFNVSNVTVGTRGLNIANSERLGFFDTSNFRHQFRAVGTSFGYYSVGLAGAERLVWSIVGQSDTTTLNVAAPVQFQNYTQNVVTNNIAAAGTVLGTATLLNFEYSVVTTCTAGVNDGVRLRGITGLEQTVWNRSAAPLKVYPPNTGSGQINSGGVGVPLVLAAGTNATFVQIATSDVLTKT